MTFTFEEAVFRAHLQNIGPWTSGGKTPQEAIQNTMRFIVASNARQQYKDMLPVDKKTGQKIAACPGCPEGQSGCTFGANNGTVDLGAAVPVNPVFSVNAHGYVTCTISDVNWNLATGFEPSAEVGCSACRGGKCTGDSSSATPNAKTGTDSAGKVGTTTQPE